MRAPEARDEHSPHLLDVELAIQPPICRCENGIPDVQLTDPIQQRRRSSVRSRGRPPAAGDLQKHDTEAEDVGLQARPLAADELRINVAGRSGDDLGCTRVSSVVDEPRQAEVPELGAAGSAQQDVGGLHVPVQDALLALRVEAQ